MAQRSLAGEAYAKMRALSTEIDRLDQAAADRFLEEAGYVRRRNDPRDRRRQVVETTEATVARGREVFQGLIEATTQFLSTYTDEQLLLINDFLTRMGRLTTAYAETLSRRGPDLPGRPSMPSMPSRNPGLSQ